MSKRIACTLLAALLLAAPALAQETEQPLRERVETVNVEVPVRVFDSGRPVMGLKKEDFALYEGKIPQTINGFYVRSKKIALPSGTAVQPAAAPAAAAPPSRYFALVFRVHEFNQPLRDGLSYVMDHILGTDDQLVVFVNNITKVYPQVMEKEKIRAEIEQILQEQCVAARSAMITTLRQFEEEAKRIKLMLKEASTEAMTSRPSRIANFIERARYLWRDFKRCYLTADIDSYYNFAQALANIKKEKWVINFHQSELYPRMNMDKDVRRVIQYYIEAFKVSDVPENYAASMTLSMALQELDKEIKTDVDFPVEEVSKLFYKVNATFHTLFIRTQMEAFSEDLEFKAIGTSVENSLRELTRKTGGNLVASTDLVSSLAGISEVEDVVYMLTYAPGNPKKVGKIRVQVAKGKYEVLYDDNMRADYISDYLKRKEIENPTVKFRQLSFARRRLSLALGGFRIQDQGGKASGRLAIRVQVKSTAGETVFDRSRSLETLKDPVTLSLDFPSLAAGKYDLIVEVRDLLSGKSCTDFLQPVVE